MHHCGLIARCQFLAALLLCVASSIAGEAPAANQLDALAGAWRGYLTQGGDTWYLSVGIRGKGKTLAGNAIGWCRLPEQVALQARPGGAPKDHPKAMLYTEALKLRSDGDGILVGGSNLRCLIGTGLTPDVFRLVQVSPGVLAGELLKEDGKPHEHATQVLLCTQASWDRPTLAAPPSGERTAITCIGTNYHYQVYVPKSYDPAKPAPLVIYSAAGGDAQPWDQALADELGWISVGLTESRNGPWGPINANRDAALFDLRQRLNIDWRKVIFGGDSGGARASARAQLMHPDLCAGLLMCIAGYDQTAPPLKRVPIFFITGDTDFNLDEILVCHGESTKLGRATELLRHQGGHESGGDQNITKALRWLHARLGN